MQEGALRAGRAASRGRAKARRRALAFGRRAAVASPPAARQHRGVARNELPPAGALRFRDGVIPPAIDPGKTQQTGPGSASVGWFRNGPRVVANRGRPASRRAGRWQTG